MRTLEEARQQGQREGMTYAAAMLVGSDPEACAQIRANIVEVKSTGSKMAASPDQGQRAFSERELEYVSSFEHHARPFVVAGCGVSN